MRNRSGGFTILELVVVMMVGIILTSIAMNSLQGVQGRAAARQARQVFVALHARTRATAIERGEIVRLNIAKTGDSIWMLRGTTVVEKLHLNQELGVDIEGTGTVTLCMSPRGYAETACNSFTSTQTIVFAAGGDTAGVQLQTMGQLKY
jgi:type II secretory pathway pseudopilin PulG